MKGLANLLEQLPNYDIISFDIFDTLLLRPYVRPIDLFAHVEEIYQFPGFAKARIEAEWQARQTHPAWEEITLDEIYAEIPSRYVALKEKELALERQVLFPNPALKPIYEAAVKAGKRIVILSDMYLPVDFLTAVLKEKGFAKFEKIYVSSGYRKTKATGSLYRQFLQDVSVSPARILHIGDNPESDGRNAKQFGLHSYVFTKLSDRLFTHNQRAQEFWNKHVGEVGASILLGITALAEVLKQDYWTDFGFRYAGPVILGYMKWLDQQLLKDKIKEVLFVARDGYTLEKVFNIIKTSPVRTHYFYAPRNLNLVCNLNYNHYCALGTANGLRAVRVILEYFKNKDPFLKQHTPSKYTLQEGIAFIKQHNSLYQRLAAQERASYANYFKQFHLQDNTLALVDTISMLLSAQKAVMAALPNKQVKGYYWFILDSELDFQNYSMSTFQASRRPEFVDWNMMELFMTAPTPPVERIEEGKVIFKPVNAQEQTRMQLYPQLSQGAELWAQKFHEIFGNTPVSFSAQLLTDWVNVLCSIPTEEDKAHFRQIQHAWDLEHTQYIPLPQPWFVPKQNPVHVHKFYLFGIPLVDVRKEPRQWKVMLFRCIPLLRYKQEKTRTRFYICALPLFQIRQNRRKKSTFSLFALLPLFSVKRRNG